MQGKGFSTQDHFPGFIWKSNEWQDRMSPDPSLLDFHSGQGDLYLNTSMLFGMESQSSVNIY